MGGIQIKSINQSVNKGVAVLRKGFRCSGYAGNHALGCLTKVGHGYLARSPQALRKVVSVNRISSLKLVDEGPEEKKKLIREFDEKQKEAYETLREMEEELKYAPVSFNNQMMATIRTYRRDLATFQRKMKSTDLGVVPGVRGEPKFGIFSTENDQSTQIQSQRVLLLQGTESLNRASQSIERSHQIAAETDQIGTDIIEELGEQREQLERTKGRLVNTSENLSKSRKILRSMSRSSGLFTLPPFKHLYLCVL
ncbi:vesicle transport through interaction with t-SNAREs homolog 1B isoform X2 [Pogona vitticeps]